MRELEVKIVFEHSVLFLKRNENFENVCSNPIFNKDI